ncbi:hypothetical protein AGR1B_pAt30258 [Agrobacterium fabacearum S56]|nr:hypothetical protein AGR1B_pAt30258 [Agrobacterium fabacearum S56]
MCLLREPFVRPPSSGSDDGVDEFGGAKDAANSDDPEARSPQVHVTKHPGDADDDDRNHGEKLRNVSRQHVDDVLQDGFDAGGLREGGLNHRHYNGDSHDGRSDDGSDPGTDYHSLCSNSN